MQTQSSSEHVAADAGGLRPRVAVAGGAPPSITAPPNSIRPLRHGVDSLYLSYPGLLRVELAEALQAAKDCAQQRTVESVASAWVQLGAHHFQVLPRGRGRFAFVLQDNWFHLEIANTTAPRLPLTHVQIRSEYLTAVGPEEALRELDAIVDLLGRRKGPARISRVDLFADFVGGDDLITQPAAAWVRRCHKRDLHEAGNRLTGISFGAGNEISARLYDKTLEIEKSGKVYLHPLWRENGWQGEGETVWRMEFQTRREGLPEALRGSARHCLPNLGPWWRYLATDWLRLAAPSDTDATRTRWPTHPCWAQLAMVWNVAPDAPPMTRVTTTRAPSDEAIFQNGLWGLSSFMAREGITDASEGVGEFLHALEEFFRARPSTGGLDAYLAGKARLKACRYNVPLRGGRDED